MPMGRPTVMTPETIDKLEQSFLMGASDKEAIFQANISSAAFYAYCKDNPDFQERKEHLKESVKFRARLNVVKAIDSGDKNLSQWYLERKAKDEFAQRSEHTGAEGKDLTIEPSDELKALTLKLNEIYRATGIGSDGGTSSSMGSQTPDKE